MTKSLYQSSDKADTKKLPEMKRVMEQDALVMQGVSSRLQIKEEQRRLAKQPVPIQPNSKRLAIPVENPDFITAPTGIGRMSKDGVREMHREDFGKKAESVFGNLMSEKSDDDLTFT